jgi:hypothetical protein
MKPKAYIETSIVSYLTARQSRDLVVAAHQQVTHEWWASRRNFELFASPFVVDEASAGDESAATSRLAVLAEAALLEITEDVITLAEKLIAGGGLPAQARVDALHISMAAVHGMNYLLTWNCKHIANATLRGKIEELCREAGVEPPAICTPLELPRE